MKNSKLEICDATIHPGEAANLALSLPEQYSCSPLYMPIKVIHGKEEGPCILVFSTMKGSELNGIEIVNRMINELDVSEVKGTIIAIPVVNVYGLTHFPVMLPSGGTLVDCFPGSEDGTFGERMAYTFTQEILKKADYCIELQTGSLNHDILPQVYCNFDDLQSRKLAKAFQSPVITSVNIQGNKFRQVTEDLGIPLLVYQAGEALRFDENAITLGVSGVLNVIRELDILKKSATTEITPTFSQDEEWIVAHKSGILQTTHSLGQAIKKDEEIGEITDPFGLEAHLIVKSPQDGIIVGINTTPLIYEGMSIFKIASFLDYDRAETNIEEWHQKQPDNS